MANDYHWIAQNVAQGAFPKDMREAFSVADIVVFTAEEHQPPANAKTPPGKHVVRVPLDDDPYHPIPPEVATILHDVSRRLAQQVRSGRKVLITCAMGMNRSGLLTGLTLMRAYSMPAKQAIALIRARRPGVDGLQPLANPIFERFLLAHTVAPK